SEAEPSARPLRNRAVLGRLNPELSSLIWARADPSPRTSAGRPRRQLGGHYHEPRGLEMQLDDFCEAWLGQFGHERQPGEMPRLTAVKARDLRGRRETSSRSRPPCPTCPDALLIAHDAPTLLGGYLARGWPFPERVLDLRAEFCRSVAGLDPRPEDGLPGALDYFGLAGRGL